MPTYCFACTLGTLELNDELTDAIFEAGCDDSTVTSCSGVVTVRFHREAETLEAAIRSALRDLTKAGFRIEKLTIDAESVQSLVETLHA